MSINPLSEVSNTSVNTTAYDQPLSLETAIQNSRVIAAVITIVGAVVATLAFLNKCCWKSSKVPFSSSSPTERNQGAQHKKSTGPIIDSSEKSLGLLNSRQMSIDPTGTLKLPQQWQISSQSHRMTEQNQRIQQLTSTINDFQQEYDQLEGRIVYIYGQRFTKLKQKMDHEKLLKEISSLEEEITNHREALKKLTAKNSPIEEIKSTKELIKTNEDLKQNLILRSQKALGQLPIEEQRLEQIKKLRPPILSMNNLPQNPNQDVLTMFQIEEQVQKKAFFNLKEHCVQQAEERYKKREEKLVLISKQQTELKRRIQEKDKEAQKANAFWRSEELNSMREEHKKLIVQEQKMKEKLLEAKDELKELKSCGPS